MRALDGTRIASILPALAAMLAFPDALAATCTVPGSHGSIQAAVDDASCDPIQIAAGGYLESPLVTRSLSLVGAGIGATTIWGRVLADGSAILVFVDQLMVSSGCPGPALSAVNGARLRSGDVRAEKSASAGCNVVGRIFADGFEDA